MILALKLKYFWKATTTATIYAAAAVAELQKKQKNLFWKYFYSSILVYNHNFILAWLLNHKNSKPIFLLYICIIIRFLLFLFCMIGWRWWWWVWWSEVMNYVNTIIEGSYAYQNRNQRRIAMSNISLFQESVESSNFLSSLDFVCQANIQCKANHQNSNQARSCFFGHSCAWHLKKLLFIITLGTQHKTHLQ